MKVLTAGPVALARRLLLRRSRLSEWIITLDWYRNGPLGLVLLVRDEADIIRDNLEFHLAHGVDFIVVTDNRSSDGTRDVLAEFQRLGNVVVVDEPRETYEQATWVARMVRLARSRFGAKWIIPCDADEFWMPQGKDFRAMLHHPSNVFRAHWRNMLPTPGRSWREFVRVGDFLAYKAENSKVLFGATGFFGIYQGNHDVRVVPKVECDTNNLRIYHYPVRTYAQFERKIVNGGRSYRNNRDAPGTWGWHWRQWYEAYEQGRLPDIYKALAPESTAVQIDDTMERYFSRRRPSHGRSRS